MVLCLVAFGCLEGGKIKKGISPFERNFQVIYPFLLYYDAFKLEKLGLPGSFICDGRSGMFYSGLGGGKTIHSNRRKLSAVSNGTFYY